MVADVTCPVCAHKYRPQDTSGQEVRCPACLTTSPRPSSPPASLLSRQASREAAPPASVNRTLLAQPEAMIRYNCPRCKKSLESPASFAGQKLNCPDCGQRLQIPQPSAPPPPPLNKTILATEEPSTPAASVPVRAAVPPPVSLEPVIPVAEEIEEVPPRTSSAPAAGREYCLECGVNITHRPRVQTCPDCGSLFCSAACFREHRYQAHAPKRKSRPKEAECDRCGSTARPYVSWPISDSGWILFAVLLVMFFPLCWIGLLMTEKRVNCADCGARLN